MEGMRRGLKGRAAENANSTKYDFSTQAELSEYEK